MAGSKLAKPRNLVDAERAAFRERFEGTKRFVEKAVCDVQAHEKLDAVVDLLGGGTNIDEVYEYNEVNSISSGSEITVLSYTVPAGDSNYLQRVTVSGSNIATYRVKIDGDIIDRKFTYFGGNLSEEFIFDGKSNNGVEIVPGTVVTVTVEHNRPHVGDFNARLQAIII